MKNINCTKTKAWHNLKHHFQEIKNVHLRSLFSNDKNRFKKFSIKFGNEILIDFSKNRITEETVQNLIHLAKETDLKDGIQLMFSGAKINYTENRSVLHIALRNRTNRNIMIDNYNVMIDINSVLKKMKKFSQLVIDGFWKGYTGKSISDIVNIGIGGSDLGPYMVTESLRPYKNHLNMHYVSNVDSTHLSEVLKKIKPEKTLFLIASKTFTTDETMTNASSAKKWILRYFKNISSLDKHFIALSTNINNALQFGIHINNIFPFWEWVGGRFSLWSSVGLSIILSIGFHNFEKFLDGAHAMDNHFYETDFQNNAPVLLALISIWYTNFFHSTTEAILPYDQYMHRFPAYFQQANMESNGKSIDRNGQELQYHTGPIIWGEPGTNGQHAFYQLIHQGTQLIPCDFIAPILSHNTLEQHHLKLISNFFAQTQTLAFGWTQEEIMQEHALLKNSNKKIEKTLPFKVCQGNQPTNSILVRKITPYNLGSLIALYEHKIFVQGYILNIFSFDQWGVEIGKKIAQNIYSSLYYDTKTTHYDSSTQGLINFYKYFS